MATNQQPPVDDVQDKTFEERLRDLKRNTKLLKRVPRGTRILCASALIDCVEQAVSINNDTAWDNLMTFSYKCLSVPPKQETNSLSS